MATLRILIALLALVWAIGEIGAGHPIGALVALGFGAAIEGGTVLWRRSRELPPQAKRGDDRED